jgi:O-Antigen ligase
MHVLLFSLFFVLFASRTLGFDLSLAPGLSVKNGFLYLIFAALAIEAALTRRKKLELLPIFVPFGLYAYYAVMSWVVVLLLLEYQGYSARATLISLKAGPVEHFLVLLIFFYGTATRLHGAWVLRNMVWLIILGNVVTVVDAIDMPDLNLIETREDGRVGGTIGNSNEFGAFLAFFMPAIIALYWTEKGVKKIVAGVGTVISGVAFLMAVSRGAMVGLLCGGILGAWYLRELIPTRMMIRAGAGVLVLCVLFVIGAFLTGYGELLTARMEQFDAGRLDKVSSGRTTIWLTALESMFEHPASLLTGFGWDAYSSFNFRYATHNAYLLVFYDLGLIGLTLFLLTIRNILTTARAALIESGPAAKPLLFAFVFGFFALLVAIFFGELYTSWLYVWATVGISLRIAVSETEPEPATAPESAAYEARSVRS